MTASSDSKKRPHGYRRALANRDFRWLSIGLSVSAIGSWAYNVALYVYVFETTRSAAWAGAVTVGRFLPSLLFGTYGGVIAERIERRRLLILTDLASMALMIGLTLIAGADLGALPAIMLAGVASMLGTLYYPASAAMIPQIVGEEDLAAANSFESTIENASVIAGPAIGAGVLAVSTVEVAFVFNAATFLFSAWASSRMRTRSRPTDVTEGGQAGVLRQMLVGVKAIGSSTTAFILVAGSILASFIYGTDTVLFVLVSEERLGIGPDGFGLLLAGMGIGGILMAPTVDRLARVPRLSSVISAGLIVYTMPTLALVWVDEPAIAFAIQIVRGAGTLVVDVLAVTALQRSLSSELVARVFGVFMTLVMGAIALGALVTPALYSWLGLDGALIIWSAGISTVVILVYPATRLVDRETAAKLAELAPRIAALEGLGIFAEASRPSLERLAAAMERQTVPAGTRIIKENDVADALYVIDEGQVQIAAIAEARSEWERMTVRKEEPIRTLGPGEYFGEIGLLQGGRRTASVDAIGDVTLYRLPGEDFMSALTENQASASFMEAARMRLSQSHPSRDLRASVGGSTAS